MYATDDQLTQSVEDTVILEVLRKLRRASFAIRNKLDAAGVLIFMGEHRPDAQHTYII